MAYISNDPNEGIRQVSGQPIPSGGINSFRSPGNEFVNKRRRDNNAYFNQRPREPRKPKAKPTTPAPGAATFMAPPDLLARPRLDEFGNPMVPGRIYAGGPATAIPGKPVPVKTNPIATPTIAAPPAPPVKPIAPPVKRGGAIDFGAESGGYGPSASQYDVEGNAKKQAAANTKKRQLAEADKYLEAQRARFAEEAAVKKAQDAVAKAREAAQQTQKYQTVDNTRRDFSDADIMNFSRDFNKSSEKFKKLKKFRATSKARADEDEENRRLMQAERLGAPTALEMNMKLARMAKNARKTKEASPDEY
jgi:hypothetical protein